MECKRDRRSWLFSCISIFFFFFIFFALCVFLANATVATKIQDIWRPLSGKADLHFYQKNGQEIIREGSRATARRFLGGLGSSPPRCASKCGKCTPCRPVHVPVPPGTPVTTEYYPEAWRCKCGNRLYMP